MVYNAGCATAAAISSLAARWRLLRVSAFTVILHTCFERRAGSHYYLDMGVATCWRGMVGRHARCALAAVVWSAGNLAATAVAAASASLAACCDAAPGVSATARKRRGDGVGVRRADDVWLLGLFGGNHLPLCEHCWLLWLASHRDR